MSELEDKLVQKCFQNHERLYGSAALLCAHHCPDPVLREQTQVLGAFAKSFIEVHLCYKAMGDLGNSPEVRKNNAQFLKLEGNLQALLARAQKFTPKIRQLECAGLFKNQIMEATGLISDIEELLKSHYGYFSTESHNEIEKLVKHMEPLAGGLPDGKSWKDGLQDRQSCAAVFIHILLDLGLQVSKIESKLW